MSISYPLAHSQLVELVLLGDHEPRGCLPLSKEGKGFVS